MKEIYLYPISRRVKVPDRVHDVLCVYKVFWPPEATIKVGKNKVIQMKDFTPWPPPIQADLGLEVERKKTERSQDMG